MHKIFPDMKNSVLSCVLVCLIFAFCTPSSPAWTNPMELPGLNGGSHGDPYIMKYRGYYYLYVSARDKEIYCWKSKDLADWSEPYIVCTDTVTSGAYAPEVIYWNGRFYMCTSPRGTGHYMLTSDSPTGPFIHQTGNMGRDIDGSMFVDDDGKWYFYHANNEGIRGCGMPTHLSYSDDIDLGCCITGQWTEGPCVFKRNGLYYLIYTGNHVWTNGYRIDYAISDEGPLSGFRPQAQQNPILVDTETPAHRALGHGTAFIGPDLDSYYFCYHNLQDNKARRLLNFERIGWSGDRLIMTGPTDWTQDPPQTASADFFERQEPGDGWITENGGKWHIADSCLIQSEPKTSVALFAGSDLKNYTAEFTMRANRLYPGDFGAVFSYKDADNYCEALVNPSSGSFAIIRHENGKICSDTVISLPDDFNPFAWHSVRVEKNGENARVYIDGMMKGLIRMTPESGRAGYITRNAGGDFSYIAISPYVGGNGILEVSLPVPGLLAADFCTGTSGNVSEHSIGMDVGSSDYLKCGKGSVMNYNINVQRDNVYNIGIKYSSDGAVLRLRSGDETVADSIMLPATDSDICVYAEKDVFLKEGRSRFTVEVLDGTVSLYEYNFKRGMEKQRAFSDDFNEGIGSDWGYIEGEWRVSDGMLQSVGKYGKMLIGGYDDIPMTDYTVECDIIYDGKDMNGGVIFRATNPSTGGADDNPVLGTDFLQGYYFTAGPDSAVLGRHNFGWQPLASAPCTIDIQKPHHFKIEVEGALIKCYIDDMDTPLIRYFDKNPFITGRAGVRAHNSTVNFDNFQVTPR